MASALRWGQVLGTVVALPLVAADVSYGQIDQPDAPSITEGFSGEYAPIEWRFVSIQTGGEAFLRDTEGDLFGFEPSSDVECPVADDVTPGRAFFIGDSSGLASGVQDLPASALFLRGGNRAACTAGITDVFITVPEDSLLSFNWFYSTDDMSPAYDPFGYSIGSIDENGTIEDDPAPVFFPLVDSMGSIAQTGFAEVQVKAQQVFAFEIITLDNQGGAATAVISQFKATPLGKPTSIPEPGSTIATLMLSGLGLLGLPFRGRR